MASFFQWVSLYNNIATNIIGDDRDEMLAVWDDDDKFDVWLKRLDSKNRASRRSGKEKVAISNEEYLKKYAKHHGGPGAT